jgi:hypothetical protein
MIYFIQARDDRSIKIGFAVDAPRRIRALQTGNAQELITLRIIPGDRKRDTAIRRRLLPYRKRGDWFHPTSEVLAFIKGLDEPDFEVIGLRAFAVLRRDTETALTDPCPFCGRQHNHGASDGLKAAHCSSAEARDEIKIANGERITLRRSDGYYI